MTKTERAERRAAAKAMKARLAAIGEGLAVEIAAVNAAIQGGREVRIPVRSGSLMSGKVVKRVVNAHDGIWVYMDVHGGAFALANDGRWAEICQLAGVARDSRTA